MIYYKYKADTKYTEAIFTSRKVYLSTAEGLNDPFECSLLEIGKDWINEKVKEMQQAGVAGFVLQAKRCIDSKMAFFGLSPKETEKMLDKFKDFKEIAEASAYRSKIMKKLTGHLPADSQNLFARIDAQLLGVGIFSLSINPNNQLMWSHYADEHKGICLGFKEVNGSRLSDKEHLLPVIYSDELPEMNKDGFNVSMNFSMDENGHPYTSSLKIAFSDSTLQKAISTKPKCWAYEEEWRYVEPYPGEFDWPGPLEEVIFGLKCTEERRYHYISLLEENIEYSVRLYEMRKIRGTNQLEKVPLLKSETEPKIVSKTDIVQKSNNEMDAQEFGAKIERLIRQENYGEAIFQVEENLKKDPGSPFLLSLKGTAHGYAQEPEKALECFSELTRKCPEIADSWYQQACALIELKRDKEAVDSLKEAYKINPNDPSTCFNIGVQLIKIDADIEEILMYLKNADRLGHRRAYGLIEEIEKANN